MGELKVRSAGETAISLALEQAGRQIGGTKPYHRLRQAESTIFTGFT
jgi:hypothetical protein